MFYLAFHCILSCFTVCHILQVIVVDWTILSVSFSMINMFE